MIIVADCLTILARIGCSRRPFFSGCSPPSAPTDDAERRVGLVFDRGYEFVIHVTDHAHTSVNFCHRSVDMSTRAGPATAPGRRRRPGPETMRLVRDDINRHVAELYRQLNHQRY